MEILLVFFSVFEFSVFHKTRLQWILYQEKERGGGKKPAHNTNTPQNWTRGVLLEPSPRGPLFCPFAVSQLLMRAQ